MGGPIWSGTVSFGLVAIPVRLFTAVEKIKAPFKVLHMSDNSPVSRRMYCPMEKSFIYPEHILRGYEASEGRYIPLYDSELGSVSPERSRNIEIREFVGLEEIGAVYYDRPYYLLPGKGVEKPYELLTEALRRTGKGGLAVFVLRDRQHLSLVRPLGGVLGLMLLHYQNEMQPPEVGPESESTPGYRGSVLRAVLAMKKKFEPVSSSENSYFSALNELIREKSEKEDPVNAPARIITEEALPEELLEALSESLEKSGKRE